MLSILQMIFGPNAEGNPYFELYRDAFALIPGWYPFFLAGMMTTVYGPRWLNRERFRRQTVSAAGRVRDRALQNRFFRDRW